MRALALAVVMLTGCAGSVSTFSDDAGSGSSVTGQTVDKAASAAGAMRPDGGSALLDAASLADASGATGGPSGADAADAGLALGADGCPMGAPRALNRVRFIPAKGKTAALVGGLFRGSNTSQTNDFVDLAKIEQEPVEGAFTELTFANDRVYRYIKYDSPQGSYGSVADLEFYHDDTRLEGAGFGTASSLAGVTYQLALDGDSTTEFEGSLADGNYIGLDIGGAFVTGTPVFTPAAGALASGGSVVISSDTPGAKIRYTLDGTRPSATSGTNYAGPVSVMTGRVTVTAQASAECHFDSATSQATYAVGTTTPAATKGFKSYHIGNSLTDTINPWLEPIADSTGVDHSYARWTIPGSTVKYLWEHKGEGFGTPAGAENFDSFVQTFAPIDHLTIQPFADPSLQYEGLAGTELYQGVLTSSPDAQLWIYAQWASPRDWAMDALANGASWAAPAWSVPTPATDWTSATRNQRLYHEAYRQYVDDHAAGKTVLVIPAGDALIELKRQIEAGLVPGISDFFGYSFQDELHLTRPVQYLVALVFYSCFYKQTPQGRVVVPPELGLTTAQATALQQIAWSVASAYPLSGITSP
ncbi:MAG: hypothetical protein JWN04_5623 [Myxococcaceae bacterium]|nr:hypothetical protein [Myxococcaceae bacterium]